jgi:cation diffusion facilitator CzcD-associated flavoprotein CzcO
MQADVGGPQTNGVNSHTTDGNFDIEAIVIGAGFSGLRMLYELRKRGISGKVFESGSGVGGVCILSYCLTHFTKESDMFSYCLFTRCLSGTANLM